MSDVEFRDFVAAQLEPLRGLAYLTCGDWQTAEDAVLTVLARLYARWDRIDSPDAYARSAVIRAVIDETRRPWWRRERPHSHAMPEQPVVDDGTVVVDDRLRIRTALQRLPAKQRAVIVLRYLEGLSVQQTAEALGWPDGTVKAYTARGLAGLREVLGSDLHCAEEGSHAGPARTASGR